MKSLLGWLQSLVGGRPDDGRTSTPHTPAASTPLDLLERARSLAREGKEGEASEVYWKIKRRHCTAEVLVEHAELLLSLGNHFDAATRAAEAQGLDPENARARAVQREILRREDQERRPA